LIVRSVARATALALLLVAGTAVGGSLESLVMPGPVFAGHADVEDDCRSCHDPFDADAQRGLCLDCHESIAQDIGRGKGFHGRSPDAVAAACKSCHSEHLGRAADISGLQPEFFDHALTDFRLEGAHADLVCASCHAAGARPAAAPASCHDCHREDDPHGGRLGERCGSCHTAARWDEETFDHASTNFPLTGSHARQNCESCHADARFASGGNQCVDCHRQHDPHAGTRGDQCASCHDTTDWKTELDHAATAGFVLVGAHAELACGNCHVAEPDYGGLASGCSACHAADDAHRGRNGADCGACHGQVSWAATFDHAAKTGFPLRGGHAPLPCAACHVGKLEDQLPTDCAGCHAAEDPHGDTRAACGDCHDDATWAGASGFRHDRASFALVGMHRNAVCDQCHETLAFTPTPAECRDCHAVEEPHNGAFGVECATCHNPVGWDFAQFDHARQTDFALGGAHAELVCEACHAPGVAPQTLGTACIDCHRADDVHHGGFGAECDRCHDPESFENPAVPTGGVTWRP
jgi:Zn finger protein HypA/HybF involved in hydrogenase expression